MLNQKENIIKTITSKSSVFTMRTDGILTVEPKENFKSLSHTELALDFAVVDELTHNKKALFLTDNRKTYGLNSEQRNHVRELLNSKAIKCAVILNNDLAKYFFNFFNHLYKLKISVKAFSNKNDAIIWLISN
jgi:hypothetical protein